MNDCVSFCKVKLIGSPSDAAIGFFNNHSVTKLRAMCDSAREIVTATPIQHVTRRDHLWPFRGDRAQKREAPELWRSIAAATRQGGFDVSLSCMWFRRRHRSGHASQRHRVSSHFAWHLPGGLDHLLQLDADERGLRLAGFREETGIQPCRILDEMVVAGGATNPK